MKIEDKLTSIVGCYDVYFVLHHSVYNAVCGMVSPHPKTLIYDD